MGRLPSLSLLFCLSVSLSLPPSPPPALRPSRPSALSLSLSPSRPLSVAVAVSFSRFLPLALGLFVSSLSFALCPALVFPLSRSRALALADVSQAPSHLAHEQDVLFRSHLRMWEVAHQHQRRGVGARRLLSEVFGDFLLGSGGGGWVGGWVVAVVLVVVVTAAAAAVRVVGRSVGWLARMA